jgi:hypothetical protein
VDRPDAAAQGRPERDAVGAGCGRRAARWYALRRGRSVSLSLCLLKMRALCRSVALSLCLSVPLSLCLSVSLSLCPSVPLSLCPSVPLSLCLSDSSQIRRSSSSMKVGCRRERRCPFSWGPTRTRARLFCRHPYALSVSVSICASLSISVSVCHSVSLSLCVCVSLSLCVSLCRWVT